MTPRGIRAITPGHPTVVTLTHANTPPSLNRLGTRGSHWAVTRAKQEWQGVLEVLLMASGLPRGVEHVTATAVLRFPVARPRDVDNHAWLLTKALGDALQRGGWIADDTPAHFTFERLTFADERGPRQTVIHLEAQR